MAQGLTEERIDRPTHRWWLAAGGLIALGGLRLIPGLSDGIWQDEAVTLLVYAAGSFWQPFSDYSLPNNHMALSAVLSTFWPATSTTAELRSLPAALWLLTCVLMCTLGRRLVGTPGALIGLAVFASSSLSADYGLGLRGYAASWPIAVLSGYAAWRMTDESWSLAALAYLGCSVIALALLPTNIVLGAICVVWIGLVSVDANSDINRSSRRVVAIAALSLAGLIIYWPHIEAVRSHANSGWSDWNRLELIGHWLLATLGPYGHVGLLAALGCLALNRVDTSARRSCQLLLASVSVPIVLVLVAPRVGFPRNLIPLFPLLCLSLGGCCWHGLRYLGKWPQCRLPSIATLVAFAIFAVGLATPPCLGLAVSSQRQADLCGQFYHRNYYPDRMLDELLKQTTLDSRQLVVDTEAAWALGFVALRRGGVKLDLTEFKLWPDRLQPPRYVVANDLARLQVMLEKIGFQQAVAYQACIDTGYFKLFCRTN